MSVYRITANVPLPNDPMAAAHVMVGLESAIEGFKAALPADAVVEHGPAHPRQQTSRVVKEGPLLPLLSLPDQYYGGSNALPSVTVTTAGGGGNGGEHPGMAHGKHAAGY